jgi:hypothetical protein
MKSREAQIERVANEIKELFGAGPSLAEQIKALLMKEFYIMTPEPRALCVTKMYLNKRCVDCHWYQQRNPDTPHVGLCEVQQLEIVCGMQTACDDFEPRELQLSLPGVNDEVPLRRLR